jgi:hypothetical protein
MIKAILGQREPKTRNEMVKYLLGVKGFEGTTGLIDIQPNGEAKRPLYLLTVKKDKIELLGDSPASDKEKKEEKKQQLPQP